MTKTHGYKSEPVAKLAVLFVPTEIASKRIVGVQQQLNRCNSIDSRWMSRTVVGVVDRIPRMILGKEYRPPEKVRIWSWRRPRIVV